MAKLKSFQPNTEGFQEYITRVFQSSNINFLLGAGASNPAITVAGDIENRIQTLYDAGNHHNAKEIEYDFLHEVQKSVTALSNPIPPPPVPDGYYLVLVQYIRFLNIIESILRDRKNNLLAKKANIFSTNYDLFIEKAALNQRSIILNDGFQVRASLKNDYIYDIGSFSRTVFESSSFYDYKVEVPVINLIKMHGSMSWRANTTGLDQIHYCIEDTPLPERSSLTQLQINEYIEKHFLIFPKKEKFKTTLLNRTYYDLLRLYSNELDKEQTTLIAFGFSFRDEHIFDLTKRALRNSTLKLIIFCFDFHSKEHFNSIFSDNHNVDIIFPSETQQLDFENFNKALESYTLNGVVNGH